MSKTEFLIPLIPAHSSFSSSVLHVFNKWHYHLPQFSDQKSMYHYSIYNFMVFASFGKFFTSVFSNMALAPFSFPSLWDSKINMLTLSTRFHISLTHFPYFCFFMLHFSYLIFQFINPLLAVSNVQLNSTIKSLILIILFFTLRISI